MQILNNIPAFTVWKSYNFNVSRMRDSMSKLASGLRIVNAGDDAAGLAMSERLRQQYRNTAKAALNIEGNLNYWQTADGWLQKIQDILGRMGELAIQANDSTKAQIDRDNLQVEFRQMQYELSRITSGATAAGKFNGLYLFRGGNGVAVMTQDRVETGLGFMRVQVGPDSNQVIDSLQPINLTNSNYAIIGSYGKWSYGSINMTALGSTFYRVKWASIICAQRMSISVQTNAQAAVDKLNVASDFISGRRAIFGAMTNRLQQTLEGLRSYEENARAAESRIRDVDVAAESTQFSKFQVLSQMGTALLAQANALPNNVLALLGR